MNETPEFTAWRLKLPPSDRQKVGVMISGSPIVRRFAVTLFDFIPPDRSQSVLIVEKPTTLTPLQQMTQMVRNCIKQSFEYEARNMLMNFGNAEPKVMKEIVQALTIDERNILSINLTE